MSFNKKIIIAVCFFVLCAGIFLVADTEYQLEEVDKKYMEGILNEPGNKHIVQIKSGVLTWSRHGWRLNMRVSYPDMEWYYVPSPEELSLPEDWEEQVSKGALFITPRDLGPLRDKLEYGWIRISPDDEFKSPHKLGITEAISLKIKAIIKGKRFFDDED